MLDRIMGVITLKSAVYREIAEDPNATGQAATIVVVVALIQGLINGLVRVSADGTVTTSLLGALIGAIITLLLGLVAWGISSWILATVATMLGGKTDTGEMLRVTGFVDVFNLVSILNLLVLASSALACITGLLGLVIGILAIVGYVIGVREAGEFSTGRAVVAAIVAALVEVIIFAVAGVIVGGILVALSH